MSITVQQWKYYINLQKEEGLTPQRLAKRLLRELGGYRHGGLQSLSDCDTIVCLILALTGLPDNADLTTLMRE